MLSVLNIYGQIYQIHCCRIYYVYEYQLTKAYTKYNIIYSLNGSLICNLFMELGIQILCLYKSKRVKCFAKTIALYISFVPGTNVA